MRKVKILHICVLIIVVFSVLSTNVMADVQKDYTPGSGWKYQFDPNNDPQFYDKFTIEEKNAHLGIYIIKYKIDISANSWVTYIEEGMDIISDNGYYIEFINKTNTVDSVVCIFESKFNLPSDVWAETPIEYHNVNTLTNHVTDFVIWLNPTNFNSNDNSYTPGINVQNKVAKKSTVAHEIGHGIGLAHIDNNASIMKESAFNTSLTAGDKKGIQAVTGYCDYSNGGHILSYTDNGYNHKKTCDVCGAYAYEDHGYTNGGNCICGKQPSHTHTPKANTATPKNPTNTDYHAVQCNVSGCSTIYDESHSWTVVSTFGNDAHSVKCTKCQQTGYRPHELGNVTEWDGTYHYKICQQCGRKVYQTHDKSDGTRSCSFKSCLEPGCGYYEGSHDWTSYISNGSAGHYKKCACGATDTTLISHSLSYVSNGSSGHYTKCNICGYTTSNVAHTLSYIQNGSTGHYTKCNTCGYTTSTVAHGWINGTCTYKYCGSCGYSTGSSTHNMVSGTCTYKYCSNGCGYSTGSSTHSLSYVQNGSSGHYTKCNNCTYTTSTVAHGWINGTCTYKYCGSCGYSTGSSSHSWSYTQNGASTHNIKCSNCNTSNGTESHSMSSGTCDYKYCTKCGYSTGSSSHSYSYVQNGSTGHYQKCSKCSTTTSTVAHSYSWVQNGSAGHYTKCGTCGYATATVAHGWVTVNGVKKCGSCGYLY